LASLIKQAEAIIPEVDVILISDYGKGLVTRSLIAKLVSTAKTHGTLTIADPKGLDFSKYAGVSLITPNKKEASLASGIEFGDEDSPVEIGKNLLQKIDIKKLLITCGKDGMLFFESDRQPYKIGTRTRDVYDVSGAGDTVIAVLGLGVAAGLSFHDAIGLANTAAGIVVGKVGTATITPKELTQALQHSPAETASKYKSLDELSELCKKLRKNHKRIVMTNGCFDLLHVGHVKLFSASKELGDVLIVAIDDDDSVTRLKGVGRPVISAQERVRILSALDSIDYVLVFSSDELAVVLETLRPDVLTKGSDYKSENVRGHEIVESYDGQVVLIALTEEISTTQIINNIKNQ
jgi:D-beta-D-heptose 7-phosphate kinase/D-beta-D-heptose 1-phosphate adenosyltransferase